MRPLDRLLDAAGPSLSTAPPAGIDWPAPLGSQLAELLARRNGFYAFESALHLLPASSDGHDLASWNDAALWRHSYADLADGMFCFAEDVFGGQFAITTDEVIAFDSETGQRTPIAGSLEGWADAVLADYQFQTGYPLAHQWQQQHGALPAGQRLLPKRPFVLGGKYEVDNLYAMDAARGMRLRGELAVQIRDLPDGATIRYTITE
ncbi:MAG TPA: hypothetical protein VH298_15170 [Jatrophihabitans sp.]|jgi:hypothetical protein|nr:hypothetical protein [Jatrophihabitans sp.]